MGRLQLQRDRGGSCGVDSYKVVMLSGVMRGGDVAYGCFDQEGRFVYNWDEGLHWDFSKTEAAKLIDKAIANGEQYSTLVGTVFDSEIL